MIKQEVPLLVKQYVKKALLKQEERKVANYQGNLFVQPYNTIVGGTGWYNESVFPVAPYGGLMNISQGSGQGDRIGNKIKTRKCIMDYIISPSSYNATTNTNPEPIDIRLLFVKARDDSDALPSATDLTHLFQNGDSSVAPSGILTDMISQVNNDLFILKAQRKHKLGYSVSNGTGYTVTTSGYSNNDYSLNIISSIDVTKMLPATLHYNDAANYPNDPLLYCVMLAARSGGGAAATSQQYASFWYSLRYEYVDA